MCVCGRMCVWAHVCVSVRSQRGSHRPPPLCSHMCIVGKERGRRCLPLRVALSLVGRDINVVEKTRAGHGRGQGRYKQTDCGNGRLLRTLEVHDGLRDLRIELESVSQANGHNLGIIICVCSRRSFSHELNAARFERSCPHRPHSLTHVCVSPLFAHVWEPFVHTCVCGHMCMAVTYLGSPL